MTDHVFTVAHMFCGIGGSALGAAAASAKFGEHTARFVTLGGIDFDTKACQDFEDLTGAPALVADIHTLQPAELLAFLGPRRPDVVMSSPPCKGFSRLISSRKAAEPKYQRMNRLLLDALFLLTSTWDEPPPLMFFENVPGIDHRGKDIRDQAVKLLTGAGYAVDFGTHDCGEIGGLAQRRPRWFMVARHRGRLPHLVYKPRKQRVRACGEVLGPLPMPGDVELGGPLHVVPRLSWKNWKRLAAIPAGGDARDLIGGIPTGKKRREVHARAKVGAWDDAVGAVTGPGGIAHENIADPRPMANMELRVRGFDGEVQTIVGAHSGAQAVADPRPYTNRAMVAEWNDATRSVTGATRIDSGAPSVADPRPFGNVDRVKAWDEPTGVITHSPAPSSGAPVVADPRVRDRGWTDRAGWQVAAMGEPVDTVIGNARPSTGKYSVADDRVLSPEVWQRVAGVMPWTAPADVVTSGASIHTGANQVADPRVLWADGFVRVPRNGAYGVLAWDAPAFAVTAMASVDNGRHAVADPRIPRATQADIDAAEAHPDKAPPFVPVIIADDGTWHRPLTKLELLVLQGFPAMHPRRPGPITLAGTGTTRWGEAIGNAVPPPAAEAVARQLLRSMLLSALGAFELAPEAVWVAPGVVRRRIDLRQLVTPVSPPQAPRRHVPVTMGVMAH